MNATEMAHGSPIWGTKRDFLSGHLDTLPTNDECVTTVFHGSSLQERTKKYVRSLQEPFIGCVVHEWYIIQESPRDHTLTFQSERGKSIFGDTDG